jgi:hypothetical protein
VRCKEEGSRGEESEIMCRKRKRNNDKYMKRG